LSPTQFKLILAALALGGAAVGGGVAYWLLPPAAQGGPGKLVRPTAAGTPRQWPAHVLTIAGDGLPGAGNGGGRRTRFADPYGVVQDSAGNLYVADGGNNNTIRKIAVDGTASVLAGGQEGYAEGQGGVAAFNTPSGLAIDRQGNLYVADTGNNAIRKVTPQGLVSTVAGDGLAGNRDGHGATAQFNGPLGVAVAADGVLYVADTYNDRIRRIALSGEVTTIAGGARAGLADGPAAQALFDTPTALVLSAAGDLYIADSGNHAIRKLGKDGQVSTVAVAKDDERDALLRAPVALALSADGYLYAASGAHGRIAQITPQGEVLALVDADQPAQPGYGSDGTVRLYAPRGLALGADGSLFATDGATFRLHHLVMAGQGEAPPPEPPPGLPAHGATMLWPIKPQDKPHEVVGLMGEVRGNFDGEARDHFHSGLDVQAAIGTPVLAVSAGKVSDPRASWGYGELSEGLALDGLQYIHLRVGRDGRDKIIDPRFLLARDAQGKPQSVRVKRGTRFVAGDVLGTVNRMAHLHLDYKPNGDALNPLQLPFLGLADTTAPQIHSISIVDAAGQPLKDTVSARLRVPRAAGGLQIVVDASDQIDGDQQRRRLGLYRLGYQLLNENGETIPGMAQPLITQQYDRLPRNRAAVKLAYAEGSGITVHGAAATHFRYAINNQLLNGKLVPGTWQVGQLGPGNYILRITAEDYAGNAASRGRDLAITVD